MATKTWLQSKLENSAGRVGYEIERLLIAINEEVVAQMEAGGITRAELARRLEVDKSHITRMLNGMPNMTLKTLVSVASALDCRVSVPRLTRFARPATERFDLLLTPILRFARPASASAIRSNMPTNDTYKPISGQQTLEVRVEELCLEVKPDDPAAAA
jgi:transcriptional regulator with XRE-family HTH domain